MVFIDYMGIFFGEVAKSPTHFKIRLPVFFLLICENDLCIRGTSLDKDMYCKYFLSP